MHKLAAIAATAAIAASTLLLTIAVRPATADAAGITSQDFIKANGTSLTTASGSTTSLRGVNLGGWLTQEDWMSPLGEFAVDRTGWTVAASSAGASNVIDGSRSTSWTTPGDQSGGEWLRIDLGADTRFDRLSIDNNADAGSFPASVDIAVSTDGSTWRSVATAPGADGVTTARFVPQIARYVRVTEGGSRSAPWSVGELNLFFDPAVETNGWTATATSSANGRSPSMGVDGNLSTMWQTGTPQTPGQSFTLDLGRNVDIYGVLVDAGAATANDYPRSWELFTSTDNVNFSSAASGYGTNRTIRSDFNGWHTGRYLKIVSNGTAPQWWSIAEISIATGNSLDRSAWNVTASDGGSVEPVLDGDAGTRWSSGTAQTAGQSIQVDLGAVQTINNVTLDTARNSTDEGDWPRSYRLELSKNGTSWTTVATGAGNPKATSIGFVAQATRYARLSLTAGAPQWWSIGELTAGLYNDDYSLNNTITARFGRAGAQTVLDAHQNAWLQDSDLDNIQAAGLNYVRLPMSWNTFLNLDGSWKTNSWRQIDWLVNAASARGIYVLLDLHTVPGGGCPYGSCGRVGPNPNGFWGSTTYQNWVADIWTKIATRYKGNPAVAGYDLINEPLIDNSEDADDRAQKNALFDRLYHAVRDVDPDHLVVLPGFFDLSAIDKPSVHGWTNVMYELHPYNMSAPMDWAGQNDLVTNELAAIPQRFRDYGVPLLNGEFSLYYNDDLWSRFTAGMNAEHVSWSSWTYKVTGTTENGFAYWGMYFNDQQPVPIINSDDSATFVAKLGQFTTANFAKNQQLVQTIKKYAGGRSTYSPVTIDHTGWTATASSSAAYTSPAAGLDGANDTPWTSGHPMNGSEWYRIDLGAPQSVAMVTVQAPASGPLDYARGLKVEVSSDGSNWTTVVTTSAFGWKRPVSISPTTARFVRISQTGVSTHWWSIDDVTLYSSY